MKNFKKVNTMDNEDYDVEDNCGCGCGHHHGEGHECSGHCHHEEE